MADINPFDDVSPVDGQAYNPFEVNVGAYDDNDYERNEYNEPEKPVDLRANPPTGNKTSKNDTYGNDDYGNDGYGNSMDDLDRREMNLIKKERELMQFEENLEEKKEKVEKAEIQEDNWPCKAYPLAYHDIKKEIPIEYQADQNNLYMIVLCTFLCLVWNMCCTAVLYFEASEKDNNGGELMWSFIYCFTGMPGAWILWYRALYWALSNERTLKWLQFFFFFFCHIGFCILATIGIKGLAMAGVITMVNAFNDKPAVGFCVLICAALWGINAFMSVRMIKRAYALYKNRGGDLRTDATGLKDQAAVTIASSTIKHAVK